MFFDGYYELLRIVVVGILGYAALVTVLRLTGKRTLSKMNAFDLVITVTLGSAFANVLLSAGVALAEGVLAFAVLCLLQLAATWASTRSRRFKSAIKARPALLFEDGRLLGKALDRERVVPEEVLAAVRAKGIGRLENVAAVVLETDGTFSVIEKSPGGMPDVLDNVVRPDA